MTKKFSKVNEQRKTKRNRNKGKNKTRVLYSGGEVNKFMLLHKVDSEKLQSFIYFMPYNKDNENTINSFAKVILQANYDSMEDEGDYFLKFEIDSQNLVSENTVNEMQLCNFAHDGVVFLKLDGIMKDPFNGASVDNLLENYPDTKNGQVYTQYNKIALLLSDTFREKNITDLFE